LLIGLILSFVLAIMSLIIGNRAAKPINELIKQTLNISEGDYNSKVFTKRTDEIGQLYLSFNKMTSNLKETTTSLDNLNLEIVERKEAEAKIKMLSRMPSENPHPVLRVKQDGTIIYANKASNVLLQTWKSSIGENLPTFLSDLVYDVYKDIRIKEVEFTAGDQIFSLVIVPIAGADLLNIYGRDITEQKQAAEVLVQSEATIRNKLKAITEPEGDIEALDLADIVDSDALQLLMEQFYKVVPVASAIGNLSGEVMASVGWQDICTKFHRCNPETAKNCHESDTVLAGSVPFGEFKAYNCKNNMWDVSAPIEIAGKHFGNILIGQFFYADEEVDINKFKQMARKYGFDEAEYLEALGRVPRLTRQAADAAMAFLSELAKLISHMSFSTIQQSRLLAERELSEQALQESRVFNESLLNTSPDIIYIYDIVENKNVYSNDGMMKILDYTKEDLKEMGDQLIQQLMHPDDLKIYIKETYPKYQKLRDNELHTHEFRMKHKNGAWYWLLAKESVFLRDTAGKPIQIFGIVSDITERKQAEKDLLESEKEFRSLYENSPFGIMICSLIRDSKGNVIDFIHREGNSSIEEQTGLKLNDLVGKKASEIVDDKVLVDLVKMYGNVVSTGQTINYTQYFAVYDRTLEVRAYLLQGDLFIINFVDISTRIKAEEAMRKQKNMFELVINSVPSRIFWKDINSVYLGCNISFLEAVGKDKIDDVLGKNDFDLIWAKEAEKYINDDRQVIEKGIPKLGYEESYFLPNGKKIWWQTSKMPLKDHTGKIFGLLSTSEDITERKQSEEELNTSRDLLSSVLENIPIRVFWKDTDLRYLGCNYAFAKDAGMLHPEDLIGKDDSQMGWSEDAELYNSDDQLVIDSNTPKLGYEEPQTTPDGRTVWLHSSKVPLRDAKGQVVGLLGIYDDITDRKQAEEKIKNQIDTWQTTFSAMSDSVSIIDLDGNISQCNAATLSLFNIKEEDIKGKKCFELVHGTKDFVDDCPLVWMKDSRQPESMTFKKNELWLEVNVDPIFNSKDELVGAVHVVSDITDRKKAEKEHERLQGQLRQAQKMESVGRLAGGVAHDYNNISSIIMGYSELALDRLEQSDPLYGDLMEIVSASKRSADITRQLLAFARKQTVAPKVLDLNDTIGNLLKMLRRLIGEDINLAWIPGIEVRPTKIDPSQINQIMVNLCVNARDAIANVGRVTVETKNITLDEDYCVDHEGSVPGEYIQLSVSDDGCGMTPEIRDKIFEPFFTTKGIGEGTGLGLSTVYGIVKQNNGFVNVYSEVKKGTTFRIYLPIHVGQTVKADSEKTIEIPLSRGETVLLVEDDESILKIIKRVLEKLGYAVLSSSSPMEAVGLAAEHADEINLLITDVVMPEMNGRELSDRLQSLYPNLKTLFMSGYTADIIAKRGVLESGVSFIEKPFSNQELAVKVREVLDEKKV